MQNTELTRTQVVGRHELHRDGSSGAQRHAFAVRGLIAEGRIDRVAARTTVAADQELQGRHDRCRERGQCTGEPEAQWCEREHVADGAGLREVLGDKDGLWFDGAAVDIGDGHDDRKVLAGVE
ncbi:unannotated protein [freshwater metagenome]|uniref:Unannotated protein n=1 Tax=freshwater metagenome TaxID=449393 RepID=A0A6J6V6H6_9ZZZZ